MSRDEHLSDLIVHSQVKTSLLAVFRGISWYAIMLIGWKKCVAEEVVAFATVSPDRNPVCCAAFWASTRVWMVSGCNGFSGSL